MIKWIFIGLMVLIALFDYVLLVACSRLEDRETYEKRKGTKDE